MDYESFRVLISPNVAQPGTWSVQILDCPVPGLRNQSDTIVPVFTRGELLSLRNAALWPDPPKLQSIGENVWKSVMAPNVRAAYQASRAVLAGTGKGLRVVFVVSGQEADGAGAATVRLAELPVEAIFENAFLANDVSTPVSRSLAVSAPYDTRKTPLPLRILIVIATPLDLPNSGDMQAEQDAITRALTPLRNAGTVEFDFCTNATRSSFLTMIANRYHVVHFIGHGAFDTVGDDTTPVPFISFEDPNSHDSDPVDASVLRMHLLNTDVRLVVLTSCASAAPTPANQEPYAHRAFDGIAQSLVGGVNGIPAVVAMQFDMETNAAVVFSQTFYDWLLRPGTNLDEAVTRARIAVATTAGAGHRAWVTPTVYWNSDGVALFEPVRRKDLDPATAARLYEIEGGLKILRNIVQQIAAKTPEEQQALANMRAGLMVQIDQLEDQRAQLIGDSLRLWGGSAKRGAEVELKIELRLRLAETIGLVEFEVKFDPAKLTFSGSVQAAETGINPAVAPGAAGTLRVVVPNASNGAQWAPGRYNLGSLRFAIAAAADTIVNLELANARVTENGAVSQFTTLDPVIFVD